MASPKKKIPVDGSQPGLNAAFAQLQMDGLPAYAVEEPQSQALPAAQERASKPGRVVLRRLTAHRGGKTVVLVDGFAPHHSEEVIGALGKRLRAALGCGGTVRGRALEMQGDHPAKVRAFLEAEGFQVAGER